MLTPYAAAKITNILLARNGVNSTVRPQMLYNYAKKNIIQTVPGTDNKIYFDEESFKTWVTKYIEKLQNGTSSTRNYEELADKFM